MVRPALKILSLALQFSRILELFLSLRKDLKPFFKRLVWEIHMARGQLYSRLLLDIISQFCWPPQQPLTWSVGPRVPPGWGCLHLPVVKMLPTQQNFPLLSVYLSPPKAPFTCGVQQGSILRPVLFSLYWHPLGSISTTHKLSSHPLAAAHNSCVWQSHTAFCQVSTHMLSSSSPREIRSTVHAFISLVTSPILKKCCCPSSDW